MPDITPALSEWRRLYELMDQVKTLAPWQWMEEIDLFGVQNPETEEIGFVSIMGQLGEHYAISVYLGANGLNGFWGFQNAGPSRARAEDFLMIPQLQASLEDRAELNDRDRGVIKELGLKYRGKQAWPLFRSFRPGCLPWHVESDEARFLAWTLEQVLDVAPRFKADRSLIKFPDDNNYLVRVPRREGGALVWQDTTRPAPMPESPQINVMMNRAALEHCKRLPQGRERFEMDFFMSRMTIRGEKKGDRPYFAFILLTTDTRSGMVLGVQIMSPVEPSIEAMWGQVPAKVVEQLAQAGSRPKAIRMRSDLLRQLLQPVARELGIQIIMARHLPSLDPARDSFDSYMAGGPMF